MTPSPSDLCLVKALDDLLSACAAQGIVFDVDEGLSLSEGLRRLPRRVLGASLMLGGLRLCQVQGFMRPPTIGLLALQLTLYLQDPRLRAAYQGLLSPRMPAELLEPRMAEVMRRLLDVGSDHWVSWSYVGLEPVKGLVLWYLEYLEDKWTQDKGHLVYWVRRPNGEKLYTASPEAVRRRFLSLIEPPTTKELLDEARELAERYPELRLLTVLDSSERVKHHQTSGDVEGTPPSTPSTTLHGTSVKGECTLLGDVISKARRLKEDGYWIKVESHRRRTKVFAQKPGAKAVVIGTLPLPVEHVREALIEAGLIRPRRSSG